MSQLGWTLIRARSPRRMKITPEIREKIETLVKWIDYGLYCVEALACIKHIPQEWDENDRFVLQNDMKNRVMTLGCQAYFFIYKDILNYSDKQMAGLCEHELETMVDITVAFKLQDDDVVYSKEQLTRYITQYVEDMVWNEECGVWHPKWE